MSEAWRNHYDSWKLAGPPEPEYGDTMMVDVNHKPIWIGSRVRVEYDAWREGVVEEILDPDGDVNDYGRQVMIPPAVKVRFGDGAVDQFGGYIDHRYSLDTFVCDDVEVIA